MSESIIPFTKNKPLSTFENQLCRFCFIELASREWQCYSPPIFYFNLPLRQGRCSKCSQKSRQYQSAYCIPLLLLAEEKKKILISNSGSGCWQKKVNQDEIVLPLKCMWKIYFGSTSVQRWRHCSSMAITLIQGDKRKFDNLLVSIPPPPPSGPSRQDRYHGSVFPHRGNQGEGCCSSDTASLIADWIQSDRQELCCLWYQIRLSSFLHRIQAVLARPASIVHS